MKRAKRIHGIDYNAEIPFEKKPAPGQGLTLVHFSAQRKRFWWDKGCLGGGRGGIFGV